MSYIFSLIWYVHVLMTWELYCLTDFYGYFFTYKLQWCNFAKTFLKLRLSSIMTYMPMKLKLYWNDNWLLFRQLFSYCAFVNIDGQSPYLFYFVNIDGQNPHVFYLFLLFLSRARKHIETKLYINLNLHIIASYILIMFFFYLQI